MTKPLSEYEKARRYAAKREVNRVNSKNMPGANESQDTGPVRTNRNSDMSARRAAMMRYRAYPPNGV
jgi:hypothetical protein